MAPAVAGVGLLAVLGVGLALATDQDGEAGLGQPTASAPPSPDAAASPPAPAPSEAVPEPSAEEEPAAVEPPAEEPAAEAPPAEEPVAEEPDPPVEGLPAGWTTATGGAGWTVALPPGYTDRGGGEFRDAAGRTLRVETGPGQPDAVADREQQEAGFRERNPSYERIRIAPADYRGYEAADWEFTYRGLRVFNRVFVVGGTGHSLFFQTRQGDYPDAEAEVREIVRLFQPA